MRTEAYPFDYCNSFNLSNVLFAIQNYFGSFVPDSGRLNRYGICIKHLDDLTNDELKVYFRNRIERFINILKTTNRILFVYVNEDYLYDKQYRDNSDQMYGDAEAFCHYLQNVYPDLNFQILYFDSVYRPSTQTIINVFINIPKEMLVNGHSLFSPTREHVDWYRQTVADIIKQNIYKYSL